MSSYLKWDSRVLRQSSLVVNGEVVFGSVRPFSWATPPSPRIQRMASGRHVLQSTARGGDEPLSIEPVGVSLGFNLLDEDDLQIVERAASGIDAVGLWLGWWIMDRWSVALANTGQTEYRTSRRPAWGLPTVARASYEPTCNLDGVPQTVLTTGTPGAGQVTIPSTAVAGERFIRITTPDLAGASFLELWYPVETFGVLTFGADAGARGTGSLQASLNFREAPAGVYTPLAA